MKSKISELRKELADVDSFGVYDITTSSFSFTDVDAKEFEFIGIMHESNCFDNLDHLFLVQDDDKYLLVKSDNLLGVARVKKQKNLNQILMTHKMKTLLGSIT